MEKYQKILLFIAIGFVAFPTITLGSTFVSSLIQGKSVPEAIQVLAEQIDNLLGRVAVLETKQTETTQNIEQTNLEIERLKLENENLRLKNESLSKETERISGQVTENEKAIDTVNQCKVLEAPRICAQEEIQIANKQLNSLGLSLTASLDEVINAMGGNPWYSKSQTDEICWKFKGWKPDLSQGEKCKSRETYIQSFNQDQERQKQQAMSTIKQRAETIQSSQAKFDELQCEVLLKKYVPNRIAPGCG